MYDENYRLVHKSQFLLDMDQLIYRVKETYVCTYVATVKSYSMYKGYTYKHMYCM